MTGSAKPSFELHAGALRLALRPDLGGCIAGLWHRDAPVLRSTEPEALSGSRASACYPLLPYSNRLGYRKFRWKGHEHTTQPNFDANPHSLHGVGWQRPWEIVSSSVLEVVLRLRHKGDADWPFAFEASQYFTLTPQSMHVEMVFTNSAEIAQPVGLGWHPYFVKRARSRLHIELAERWDSDATQLPVRKVAQPGIDSDVSHLAFDNCFEGWTGSARIRDEKFSLQLSSSLNRLVVFTPQDRDYFCVEPVSHVSNAIHMADPAAHGLRSLAPGESCEASMTLEVAVL
ncbi:MAG TPA: aldose 1-epimerase [Burkholderiaceae bacterium]|nr:aldose 1-epimerase [Burkholderiaceae bacterium]